MEDLEQLESRFKSKYGNMTIEELQNASEMLETERQEWNDIFEDPKSISEQKLDAWNEIKYYDDQIRYVDYLKEGLNSKKR